MRGGKKTYEIEAVYNDDACYNSNGTFRVTPVEEGNDLESVLFKKVIIKLCYVCLRYLASDGVMT